MVEQQRESAQQVSLVVTKTPLLCFNKEVLHEHSSVWVSLCVCVCDLFGGRVLLADGQAKLVVDIH